jgi:hypothetical protein
MGNHMLLGTCDLDSLNHAEDLADGSRDIAGCSAAGRAIFFQVLVSLLYKHQNTTERKKDKERNGRIDMQQNGEDCCRIEENGKRFARTAQKLNYAAGIVTKMVESFSC